VGTMTMLLAIPFPSFHFKSDDLVTLYLVEDLCLDHGLYILPECEVVFIIRQQYFAELDFVTGIARDMGNVQSLILLDFELLAGYFNNC